MSVRLVARSIWRNPGNRGRRLRKTLDAVAWQARKRSSGGVRVLRLPNGLKFNAHPDCVVSSSLVYSEWPEYDELMFVRRMLQPGDVVLDVGANVGHISLLLADVVGGENIFAFEPAPLAFRRLVENWQLNGFATHQLFELAVGSDRGKAFIEATDRPTTTLQVSPTGCTNRTVSVAVEPLDSLRHF